jgi:hypothetical protein
MRRGGLVQGVGEPPWTINREAGIFPEDRWPAMSMRVGGELQDDVAVAA